MPSAVLCLIQNRMDRWETFYGSRCLAQNRKRHRGEEGRVGEEEGDVYRSRFPFSTVATTEREIL